MLKKAVFFCTFFLISFLTVSVRGEVSLPNIFSHNMVFQREMPVPIFGTAEPNEKITVSFSDQTLETVAEVNGKWIVRLAAMKANPAGQKLTVTGKNTRIFENVVVGEVWLCTGQSNMEFAVSGCKGQDDLKRLEPLIRYIRVRRTEAAEPGDNMPLDSRGWTPCEERTGACTAVGFFFAQRLREELDGPVGLIDCSWGGSTIEPFIPHAGYKSVQELKERSDRIDQNVIGYRKSLPKYLDALEKWVPQAKQALAANEMIPTMPFSPPFEVSGCRFNGMAAPAAPFAVRGMIWYQGESNANDDQYFFKMKALLNGWRSFWNQPDEAHDFPCYFVQLANYMTPTDDPAQGDGWNRIRDLQTQSMSLKNSGMAVTIDIGDAADIHPRNKYDVGRRLAAWALAKDYGRKDLVYFGPLYKSMTIESEKIRLKFEHVGSGLIVGEKIERKPVVAVPDGKLKRFSIAGEDKVWYWADAVIDGNDVLVSSKNVQKPVAVRYAWSNNPSGCNLYNKEGFPACPFRTDSW